MSPQEKEGKERKRMKILGGLSVSFLLLGGNNKNAPYRRKGSLASQFQVTNYYCGKTRTEEEWHMFLACLLAFSLLSYVSKTPCLGSSAAGNGLNQLITKHPLLRRVRWPS